MWKTAAVLLACSLLAVVESLVSIWERKADIDKSSCKENLRYDCEDCATVMMCGADQSVIARYKCEDVDPAKPFCTKNGVCAADQEQGKSCTKPSNLCPGETGYYPDPSNCNKYVYCDDQKVAVGLTCLAASNAYNHSSSMCNLSVKPTDCFQTKCSAPQNLGKWFIYKPFPQLFFYCTAKEPIMFECEYEHEQFDESMMRCVFNCEIAGRFPYPGDKQKYYECVRVNSLKLQRFELTCMKQMVFDVKQRRCVPVAGSGL